MIYNFLKKHTFLFSVLLILFSVSVVNAQGKSEIIVHYVEGTPLDSQIAYQVNAFVSVLDENNAPVLGLTPENFELAEDSKTVDIVEVKSVKNIAKNIVLVLDTSGSMRGNAILELRNAGQEFVSRLGDNDQIAIFGFNERISVLQDFSLDHKEAMKAVSQIDAIQNAGTCLYDAVYEAVLKSATLPLGRRAVVLLTDGIDETYAGGLCSIHTFDDVVNLASDGQTRVPIYTLGIGNAADHTILQRMALLTGGQALFSASKDSLVDLFNDLSNRLNSEYSISYLSNAAPGPHTLIVTVNSTQVSDQDSRKFLLPEFPVVLDIISLTDGQVVQGKQVISTSIKGTGDVVDHVKFFINDELIGEDHDYPYSLEWDFSLSSAGEQKVRVIAEGKENQIIDQDEIYLIVVIPTVIPTKETEDVVAAPELIPEVKTVEEPSLSLGWVFIISGIVIVLVILVVIALRLKQKRDIDNLTKAIGGKEEPLAKIIIQVSDDQSMIGKEFELNKAKTLVGRSLENDIVLSGDTPVSRQHIVIEQKGQLFYLSQAFSTDLDGKVQYPKYGTFVNEEKLEENSRLLITDDEIRLGKRARIKFVCRINPLSHSSEGATVDQIDLATLDLESNTVDLELGENSEMVEDPWLDTKEELNINDKTQEEVFPNHETTQVELTKDDNKTLEDIKPVEINDQDNQELQQGKFETAVFSFEEDEQSLKKLQPSVNETLIENGLEFKKEENPKKENNGGETLIDQDFSDKTQI